jgi:CubicO group peptidase (beta-lactamase class C family)
MQVAHSLSQEDNAMKQSIAEPKGYEKTFQQPPSIDIRGFSRARLDRMHATMRGHLEESKLPGLVTLVYHRGHEYVDAIGSFAFDGNVPMQRNTIFRLASMTKPVTAVGAMILAEECKIRLDDPVDHWLPELKDRKVLRTIDGPLDNTVPAKRRITLRDLLTFQSGYGEIGFVAPTSPLMKAMFEAQLPLCTWPLTYSADEFMKRLGNLPLAHQPGERWMYHMGSEILGVMIARVTGKSLGSFLHERIFEPLGMIDTGFYVPETKLERLPTCYAANFPMVDFAPSSPGSASRPEIIVLDEARGGNYSRPPIFESGGGGLVSTADDLLAFGKMMLNNGVYNGERILSRPAIELMTMDHTTAEQKIASPFFENFWDSRGWGFGLSIVTKRQGLADVPGRFGWDGAFGTSWYVDPKEELIGIFLVQRRPDVLAIPAVTNDFWTSAYQLIAD